jgi:hypothetical protein
MDTNRITYDSSSTSPRALAEPGSHRGVTSRVGTASRKLLRSLWNNFTHKKAEPPASPLVLHLEKNKSLQLQDLTILTKPTLHDLGICPTYLLYTQDRGFTCVTFEVKVAATEDGAQFTTLSLNVCLLDSGK